MFTSTETIVYRRKETVTFKHLLFKNTPPPSYPNTKLSLCVCMGRESGHYSISGWIIDSLLFSDWSAPLLQPILFNFWLDN